MFRKTEVYKLIRNSGYGLREIAKVTPEYDLSSIKEYALKKPTSRHLLECIKRSIKILDNNKNNPVGHLDIKFKIGQDVFYIDALKGKILIRQTKVLGFGIKCPSQSGDVMYLCDLFEFDNKKIFYDNEIFHTIDEAKRHLEKAKIIYDIVDRFNYKI